MTNWVVTTGLTLQQLQEQLDHTGLVIVPTTIVLTREERAVLEACTHFAKGSLDCWLDYKGPIDDIDPLVAFSKALIALRATPKRSTNPILELGKRVSELELNLLNAADQELETGEWNAELQAAVRDAREILVPLSNSRIHSHLQELCKAWLERNPEVEVVAISQEDVQVTADLFTERLKAENIRLRAAITETIKGLSGDDEYAWIIDVLRAAEGT